MYKTEMKNEMEKLKREIVSLWEFIEKIEHEDTKAKVSGLEGQVDKLWRALRHNHIEYGNGIKIGNNSIKQHVPVSEAICLILDHLGLEIEKRPSAYRLTNKIHTPVPHETKD